MIITSLCYIEHNQCYLMLFRNKKKHDPNEGKWIGVGGKCEPGEQPDRCAVREIREETGLEVKSLKYRGVVRFESDQWPSEEMHVFTVTEFEGAIASDCNEGHLEWIPKSKLDQLPMWQGDYIFLKYLLQDSPFFRLKLCYQGDKLIEYQEED